MSAATPVPTNLKLRLALLRQLRFTPMRDLVRGRVTGRLDVKTRIASSGLREPLKQTVARVVKRTRLWKLEKADVAVELIAHFADGLEAGESGEALVERFGDERAAAKLIRRAKRRARPLAWQLFRGMTWVVAAALVIYLTAALRFTIGSPAPKVDYVTEMNRAANPLPAQESAWPIYRRAILATRDGDRSYGFYNKRQTLERPWPEVREWLARHAEGLALAREAAAKKQLGFVFGPNGSADDSRELWFDHNDVERPKASTRDTLLLEVVLPHVSDLRTIADALRLDSRLAREQGDAARNEADIVAMVGIADQMHASGRFVVMDLISMGVRWIALRSTERTLIESPPDDAGLRRLAHLLARPRGTPDLIDVEGDRDMMLDAVQRMYTDDGSGDGHLTSRGMRTFFARSGELLGTGTDSPPLELTATAPIVAASRKELLQEIDGYVADTRAMLAERVWDASADGPSALERRLDRWREPTNRYRYWPIERWASGISGARFRAAQYLAERDGVLTGIALEAYRRANGAYPDSLAALVPAYLPTVPLDPMNGEPLRYRLVDGKPLVYSVGVDRRDDGGQLPASPAGEPAPEWAMQIDQRNPPKAHGGDWRLYPTYEKPSKIEGESDDGGR